jgi:hypothetical protein
MRRTYFHGLNNRTKKLASSTIPSTLQYADINGELIQLNSIQIEGASFQEKVQAEIWSSGPHVYTALWDASTNWWLEETLWTEDEMYEKQG